MISKKPLNPCQRAADVLVHPKQKTNQERDPPTPIGCGLQRHHCTELACITLNLLCFLKHQIWCLVLIKTEHCRNSSHTCMLTWNTNANAPSSLPKVLVFMPSTPRDESKNKQPWPATEDSSGPGVEAFAMFVRNALDEMPAVASPANLGAAGECRCRIETAQEFPRIEAIKTSGPLEMGVSTAACVYLYLHISMRRVNVYIYIYMNDWKVLYTYILYIYIYIIHIYIIHIYYTYIYIIHIYYTYILYIYIIHIYIYIYYTYILYIF